jgi:hypothetical protein
VRPLLLQAAWLKRQAVDEEEEEEEEEEEA